MSNDLIIKILEVIVALAIIVVTRYIIPWLKSKAYSENINNIMTLAVQFVVYAEHIIVGEKKGSERLSYVVGLLTPLVNKFGLKLNEEQITSIVQNAYECAIASK